MMAAGIERCGGIDVGKKFLAVGILVGPLEGEPRIETRRFGTTVAEGKRLGDWLKHENITHVVMESTGSYWKPEFNVWEDAVKVYLANPQDGKNRKGHKTDNQDGWWLAHLLRHAMIQPSFICTASDSRVAGSDAPTEAADQQRQQREESGTEDSGRRQRETGQRVGRCVRGLRSVNVGSTTEGESRAGGDCPVGATPRTEANSGDRGGSRRTPDERTPPPDDPLQRGAHAVYRTADHSAG